MHCLEYLLLRYPYACNGATASAAIFPFCQAIEDVKIFSLIVSHIREEDETHTAYQFKALNRVNKQFNALIATPSILHQMVYQLAEQYHFQDEIDIAKKMTKMKAYVHPAFARWFEVRKEQRKQEEALFEAARTDNPHAIKNLIEKDRVNINARNTYGKTALSIAASLGADRALIQLLGYNVEACDLIPLSEYDAERKILISLLGYNADINLPNKYGWTPLKKAASAGHVNSVKLLLGAGAPVDTEDSEGYTPLMNAYKNPIIAQLLIDAGAAVNHQAHKDGKTTLMWAVTDGEIAVVKVLLAAGAQDNVRDHYGKNARDIAEGWSELQDHSICLKLLEEKFGKNEKL